MTEIPLVGGDVNLVVRVGDTVRRPPEPPGVVALLRWYESVGFDGAPRYLGVDEQQREMLTFIEGEPAFAPVPAGDETVSAIGRLLRRAHDAQEGFTPPDDPDWDTHVAGAATGEVIGHLDLFWTNVIFRAGSPAALIDWELAAPCSRVLEVGLAATYWAGLRTDEELERWGIPVERRGERLRILCDGYGLDASQRSRLVDELLAQRHGRLEREDWRVGNRETVLANLRWLERHRAELDTVLA